VGGSVISADTLRRAKPVRPGGPIDCHSARVFRAVASTPQDSRLSIAYSLTACRLRPLSPVGKAAEKNRGALVAADEVASNDAIGALPGDGVPLAPNETGVQLAASGKRRSGHAVLVTMVLYQSLSAPR